jgi:hypothetical protein
VQHIGEDKSVIAQTIGSVDLQVYPACTCNIPAVYEGSSSSSTVAWTGASRVEHISLVASKGSSSSSTAPKFNLRIFDD